MAVAAPRASCIAALIAALLRVQAVSADPAGAKEIIFTEYSPLATSPEIARRMLSPLVGLQLEQRAARAGKKMIEQPVNLSAEHFIVYVPAIRPPRGFAVLVFIPPWSDARLPPGWSPALERDGVIFVSAGRSGNAESVFDRRVPLALLAAHNIVSQFLVDPDAVYIAGFSGGGRVALRLALAYPDVFSGAILNAGSDPIGDPQIPLPPKELFYRFQQSTHLVYVTGADDVERLPLDQASMHSMRQWCVFGIQDHIERSTAHDVVASTAFAWALGAVLRDSTREPTRLAKCRATVERELHAQLNAAEDLVARGERETATELLTKIDGRYGGMAAPRSVELEKALQASTP